MTLCVFASASSTWVLPPIYIPAHTPPSESRSLSISHCLRLSLRTSIFLPAERSPRRTPSICAFLTGSSANWVTRLARMILPLGFLATFGSLAYSAVTRLTLGTPRPLPGCGPNSRSPPRNHPRTLARPSFRWGVALSPRDRRVATFQRAFEKVREQIWWHSSNMVNPKSRNTSLGIRSCGK